MKFTMNLSLQIFAFKFNIFLHLIFLLQKKIIFKNCKLFWPVIKLLIFDEAYLNSNLLKSIYERNEKQRV